MLDDTQLTRRFRPRLWIFAVAVALNALLFGVGIAIPYRRGQERAAEARQRFGLFAACIFGGSAGEGLALPPGERLRFADRVLWAPGGWPSVCVGPLRAIPPEASGFLLPNTRSREDDVRRAVELVAAQIEGVADLRARVADGSTPRFRIPARTLAAIDRLRAALTLLAQESDAAEGLDAPSLTGLPPARLVEGARIPLEAGASAPSRLTVGAEALWVRTRVPPRASRVRVKAGLVQALVGRVPSLTREILPPAVDSSPATDRSGAVTASQSDAILLATEARRCGLVGRACAGRALGLAWFPPEGRHPGAPMWLGAHPIDGTARSVLIDGTGAWVIAATGLEPVASLRRFALPAPSAPQGPPPAATDSMATTRPTLDMPLVGYTADDLAAFLDTEPPLLVHTATDGRGLHLRGWTLGTRDGPVTLATLPIHRATALMSCAADALSWLVIDDGETFTSVAVASPIDGDAATAAHPPTIRAAARTIVHHRVSSAAERPALICGDDSATVLWRDDEGALRRRSLGADGAAIDEILATEVAHFAAAERHGRILVAWSGRAPDDAIMVLGFAAREPSPNAPRRVSTCWDPPSGFCGAPLVAASDQRFVLGAREDADILLLESADGDDFVPLRDLRPDGE